MPSSSSLPEAFRIFYDLAYVGKLIKQAKRRVTFNFAFQGDDDSHSVVLQHTLNSGRKVIFLNGDQIYEEEQVSISTLHATIESFSVQFCIFLVFFRQRIQKILSLV
jgi:hypothetical protein